LNLHGLVAPCIGAVNPNQSVLVRISIGNIINADASQSGAYATPGSLTASIGGTFTASIPDPVDTPTTLNVAAVLTGSLQVGDVVSGSDGTNALPPGCTILSQLSGPPGGVGTYQLSVGATLNSCTVTSASTVLNVTAISQGALQLSQALADTTRDLTAGTLITGQLSGVAGGIGLYSINQQQTVASEAMTTSLTLPAQVQALSASDLRHMDSLNIQGSHRAFYFSANIRGGVRVALKGGDLLVLSDNSVWLVTQPVEPWFASAFWVKVIGTLQA
jgi:hypothetical protein